MAAPTTCIAPTPDIAWNSNPCQQHIDEAEDQIRAALKVIPFDPTQTWETSFPCPQCGGALTAFRTVILTLKPDFESTPAYIQARCTCEGHSHVRSDGKISELGCGFDCSYPVTKS